MLRVGGTGNFFSAFIYFTCLFGEEELEIYGNEGLGCDELRDVSTVHHRPVDCSSPHESLEGLISAADLGFL